MKTLVFGEILWDIFGQDRVIGGAALNFAAHLARLGSKTWLVSGVGADELGKAALRFVDEMGIKSNYIITTTLPTGACHVTLGTNGKPHYNLLDHVAYDRITLANPLPDDADALYLGTLARRSAVSRVTATELLKSRAFREIFYDINIRKPFISRDVLEEGLNYATILKVSREEASTLEQMALVDTGAASAPEVLCRALANRYPQLKVIVITLDKDGAMLFDAADKQFLYSEKPVSRLVSAVGAGDSFSACFLYNYLQGRPLLDCLNRGVRLSDYVVTQMGAIPPVPAQLLKEVGA